MYLILGIGLLLSATIYFVLLPIIVEFDPERLVESLLNLFYPLGDLALFILSTLILFSFEKGKYSVTWLFIAFGFIIMSVSDLLFSYTSWYGYYYPDGVSNLASILTDVTYALAYLLLALGMRAFNLLHEIRQTVVLNPVELEQDDSTKILIITKADNSIIVYSENLLQLIGGGDRSQIENAPLYQVLRADPVTINALMATVAREGSIRNFRLTMSNGKPRTVLLTALALTNPGNRFTGAGIVLGADLSDRDGLVPALNEEHTRLTESFLSMAGAHLKEESQGLRYYLLEELRLVYSLVYEYWGEAAAATLFESIIEKSIENGWKITIDHGQISIPDEYQGEFLAKVVSTLLQQVKSTACKLISPSLVMHEMELVDQNLDQRVARIVRAYRVGFGD